MAKYIKFKQHTKKFLSLFLSFIMIFGALSFFAPNKSVNAADTNVTTLAALRSALESTGEQTVIIGSDITISGNAIEIPSGAKITLKADGTRKLNGSYSYGAIQVKNGAQLTIDGDIIFTNGSGYFFDILGTVTMNNGTFTGNKGGDGGAIHISSGGSFVINGGTITNNTGTYGGGVNIAQNGSFTMNGGTISNNTASSSGGGVYVNGVFTMNGGIISGNKAGEGGGIYIDSKGRIILNAGDFYENNATSTYGGAIGTGTAPQSAGNTVHNAVIVGNKANTGDGRGGGIWSCPQGAVTFEEKSIIIGGNSSSKSGAQVCIESSTKPTMPTKMIGGANYEWYWDMQGKRYPGTSIPFTNGVLPAEYDSSGITLTNTLNITAANLSALKTLYSQGKVFMYNNTAACGGAVGGNGSISFIADPVSPDPDKNTLIVHKYLVSNIEDYTKPGNGQFLDPTSEHLQGAIPLEDINFKLYKINLTSHSGKAPNYADFAVDEQNRNLYSPKTDTTNPYPLEYIDSKITAKIGIDGIATFDNLDDGLYLLVEQPDPQNRVKNPILPCIIPLPLPMEESPDLTIVHIYPKNEGTPPDEGGPLFPETGGPGTFIFTLFGFILIVLPLVFLTGFYQYKKSGLKRVNQ